MAFGAMITGNSGFTQKFVSTLFLLMHPVGTPYISETPTSPAELYGGTWERIEGRFIMGASDTYPAGSTGGSATHAQTVAELATHSHTIGTSVTGSNVKNEQWSFYVSALQVYDADGYRNYGMNVFGSGDGEPMDILNPYYSMYIWRRVA